MRTPYDGMVAKWHSSFCPWGSADGVDFFCTFQGEDTFDEPCARENWERCYFNRDNPKNKVKIIDIPKLTA